MAAAAVRTLPRTASPIPMNPVRPDIRQPPMNAIVRKSPDFQNSSATPPSGLTTFVDVMNTSTANGTRMMPMVRNWRFR